MPAPSRLQSWVSQQLAAGLPAMAGARVSARIPLQVSLLNELLAAALVDARVPAPGPGAAPNAAPVDLATLARLVRHVRVDAGPGVVTLDVEAGVDG